MVLGSVPFGFSEPLRVQLEQGIEIDQLQCSNISHVLVQRTNGNVACVTERTAERIGWEIIKSEFQIVSTDESKISLTDVFITSDVKEANIPTGMFTKWITENVVRAPAAQKLSFLEQVVVLKDGSTYTPQSTLNEITPIPLGIQSDVPLDLSAKTYSDYLEYFPRYVPEGMELKGFTFSTFPHNTTLLMFYAPIYVDIDFDEMDAYEFADLGGLIVDLTHQHNDYKKGQTWENWKKGYPGGEYGETILVDNENSIFVAYGVNFLSLAMHEHMIIEFETFSFSGEELLKMAETLYDAKKP